MVSVVTYEGRNTMDVLAVLRAGRAYIANPDDWHGHCSPGGSRCTAMAVWAACDDLFDAGYRFYRDAEEPLLRVLGVTESRDIFRWNDVHERTHAEVLALFDCAITVEEAKLAEHTVPVETHELEVAAV